MIKTTVTAGSDYIDSVLKVKSHQDRNYQIAKALVDVAILTEFVKLMRAAVQATAPAGQNATQSASSQFPL